MSNTKFGGLATVLLSAFLGLNPVSGGYIWSEFFLVKGRLAVVLLGAVLLSWNTPEIANLLVWL